MKGGVCAAASMTVAMDEVQQRRALASRVSLAHGCESELRASEDYRCSSKATAKSLSLVPHFVQEIVWGEEPDVVAPNDTQ
jgi:hypothetical protein